MVIRTDLTLSYTWRNITTENLNLRVGVAVIFKNWGGGHWMCVEGKIRMVKQEKNAWNVGFNCNLDSISVYNLCDSSVYVVFWFYFNFKCIFNTWFLGFINPGWPFLTRIWKKLCCNHGFLNILYSFCMFNFCIDFKSVFCLFKLIDWCSPMLI